MEILHIIKLYQHFLFKKKIFRNTIKGIVFSFHDTSNMFQLQELTQIKFKCYLFIFIPFYSILGGLIVLNPPHTVKKTYF